MACKMFWPAAAFLVGRALAVIRFPRNPKDFPTIALPRPLTIPGTGKD